MRDVQKKNPPAQPVTSDQLSFLNQMTWLVLSKLIRRELLDPQAVFAWLSSAEQRKRLAWPSTWEGVHLVFERVS